MGNWRTLVIPLNQGLAQHEAPNSMQRSPGLIEATNLDFGTKGAVRGRPGWVRQTTFSTRSLDTLGRPEYSDLATTAATGYSGFSPFVVKDVLSERPGLVSRGRIYAHDGSRWQDRGGALAASVKRLGGFADGLTPWLAAVSPGNFIGKTGGCGYDMGPLSVENPSTVAATFGIYDTDGRTSTSDVSTAFGADIAVGARCGTVTMMLLQNGAVITPVFHTIGSSTVTVAGFTFTDALACNTDALARCRPSICCDQDETVFFVAYWTDDPGLNEFTVARISTAGALLTTATYTTTFAFGSPACIWVSNSAVANNRLVVACTNGVSQGVYSKVLNSTTLADIAVDLIYTTGGTGAREGSGGVVVGAISATEAIICATLEAGAGNSGVFVIFRRSLSAATTREYLNRAQAGYPLFTGNANVAGHKVAPLHQPITLLGRTLLGVSTTRGFSRETAPTTLAPYGPTATWAIWDITDLWCDGTATGATSGNLRDPITVARGPLEASAPSWFPMPAMTAPSGLSYRFPTIEYADVFTDTSRSFIGSVSLDGDTVHSLLGSRGVLGLNELTLSAPQVAHFAGSTILGGAQPRGISGGLATPIGFPWVDAPAIRSADNVAGGSLSPGSYAAVAIWTWVDPSGRVHRSAPSSQLNQANVLNNEQFTVEATQPHFSERENGTLFTEFYVSDVNPVSGAPMFLAGSVEYDRTLANASFAITEVNTSAQQLYTVGGVLSVQTPRADGGVATVGDRCWMSDGQRLFASRLGDEVANNEAPGWHVDDTLVLNMPVNSGRIVSLQGLEDKLVILTETGVWVTTGVGPNDLGQGPAFQSPLKVSDVGCAGMRASVSTPQGVYFQANFMNADGTPEAGGLWLLDRSLSTTQVSAPVRDLVPASAGELTFVPNREWLVWAVNSTLLVFDVRAGQWSEWPVTASGDTFTGVATARGLLWGAGGTEPASLSGTVGTDIAATSLPFPMALTIGNISLAGDPGGKGRCRSVKVMGEIPSAAYDLSLAVTTDDVTTTTGTATALAGREAEFFLSREGAGTLTISVTASRALVEWTGLALLVKGDARNKDIRRVANS